MLSKRDAPKGYVFVKANSEERLARKKAKRDIQRRKKAYDKARVKSFLTTERIKDLAAEGKQRRQQAIARRMLPSMEIPEDKPLDTEAQKEAQKEAQMESRRRMDERRQEMGLPSFAEEKEARKVRVAERSKPKPVDDTPGHVKIDMKRQEEVMRVVEARYRENIEFGATPEEALADTRNMLGDAFVESLEGADTDAFERQHDQTPMITPAMSNELIAIAQENGLDTAPYEANLKDEQITHHLGLLNEYKILRPDKVMEALDWESGHGGDEEDIHPMFKVAGALYNQAVSGGIFNPDEADQEEARRRENRAMREADVARGKERASQGFTDIPPYAEEDETPRGGSPHSVALDDAYQQFFDTADYQSDAQEELTFAVNNFTHDTLVDYITDIAEKAQQTAAATGKAQGRSKDTLKDKVREGYDLLQQTINKHAGATLNSASIGAQQKLEWGKTIESGSDPIMTPTWKKVAKTLGIGVKTKVNAPDTLLVGPLAGMKAFGGNAISPYDPKYRESVATTIGEYIDSKSKDDNWRKSLHPAITSNSNIMRSALEPLGLVEDLSALGYTTDATDERDRAGELKDEGIAVGASGHDEPGALGTPMGNLDALSGKTSKGILRFGKTMAELNAMGKEARDKYILDRSAANKKAMKRFLRTGKKYDALAGKGLDKDKLAQIEHEQMMNEVEHYKQLLAANRISSEEFDNRVGSIIAQKGLGEDLDIDLEEGNKLEMPEVPEGHYLYADKEGNALTAHEREEKLKTFMNTVVGTHHILMAAKRKMAKEGEDPSLLHNEGDLLALMKPPSKRTAEEKTRADAMTAANLDKNWLKTRLSQNNELRENIRELGVTPLRFLEQIGHAFGDGFDYDNLNQGVVKMMNKMGQHRTGQKGEFNDSLNKMLFNFIDKRHTKDMKDINHHIKAKTQHKDMRDGKLDAECVCENCIGAPERTGNAGQNRGGKGRKTSPYLYDLMKVPNLMGVPMGEPATEENPHPEGRGIETNLTNIYHELKGRGDDDESWARTDGELKAIGNPKFIKQICENLASKRTAGMTEDLSIKYGVGSRWIQAKPKGVAHDIESNPLAAEVWKHAYPAISGTEKIQADKDLQSLIKDQKKDLIGAFNLMSMTKGKLTDPKLFEGQLSSKGKRKMIKEIINASGQVEYSKAQNKHKAFMDGRVIKRPEGVNDVKIPGFNDMLKVWEGKLQCHTIDNNYALIEELETKIKGANLETIDEAGRKRLEKDKEQVAKLKADNKKLVDKATIYCKDKLVGEDGKKQVRFSSEIKRYRKAKIDADKSERVVAQAKEKVKFMPDNNHMATLASLYPQLKDIMIEQGDEPELGRLQTALDGLHDDTYTNGKGVNLRGRHSFGIGEDGNIKTPSIKTHSPLDTQGGLRGRMGETLGSRVNYSGNGYHVPIPNNLDAALAILKDKGVTVTQDMLNDLKDAEEHLKTLEGIQDEFGDVGEHMTEAEKAKANRSYTHPNRQNYSNPTGSLSRCGSCGGNGHLSQDELISYAKAHNSELQGHSISSKDMRKWITQHGRPAGYQSFDDYDARNSCETSAHDHNEYACPDCQHWDNQVNGLVSDGICGQCLGEGKIDPNDEHLLEYIEHHPHKTGVAMTPDKLTKLVKPKKEEKLPPAYPFFPPPPSSAMQSNILDEMFGDRHGLSMIELVLERIEDGELPDIHTREELDRAKKKTQDRVRESAVLDELKSSHEGGTVSFDEPPEQEPQQDKLTNYGLGFPSTTLKSAYREEGKNALKRHLHTMLHNARKNGLETKYMKDDDGKDTDISVYSAIENKMHKLLEHEYEDFEDDEHTVHDKLDRIQALIHTHTNQRKAQKELLGSDTEIYNNIQAMPEGEDKNKAMKKYMNSLYKMPSWTQPLLTHSGPRMMTQWELNHQEAFDEDADVIHRKTPQQVKDFFVSNNRGKNRIRAAFNMANGKEWDEIKAEEDKQIMAFLSDFDNLLEAGESPMMNTTGGVLKPNKDYLKLKEELGNIVPDDHYEKELPKGNMLHPNLQKHSKNAENWLRPAKKTTIPPESPDEEEQTTWEVKSKGNAIHTKIPNEVSKVAKSEFVKMAEMRAIKSFFNLQTLPSVDHLPNGADGQPMERILNSDGEPMTLEEYTEGSLDREQQSQLKNNIRAMIVDKNGNPIEDYEDKTGEGEMNRYYIVNRWPHPESHNQDMSLQEYNFNDYFDARMDDADLNLQPHTSENFASKVLGHIEKNQQAREFAHNEKYDMSYDDANKIVENANKFYDMYHFPNLYLENKMHDIKDMFGLDSLSELKELFENNPEEKQNFVDDVKMIKTIHPCWAAMNTKLKESMDHAKALIASRATPPRQQKPTMQTNFAQTFAELMNRQPPRDDFNEELKDATAQHLGLGEDGRPQPQPGQTNLPDDSGKVQVSDIFGRRPIPPAQQPQQQSLVQVMPNQNQPQQ